MTLISEIRIISLTRVRRSRLSFLTYPLILHLPRKHETGRVEVPPARRASAADETLLVRLCDRKV